jgi:hypothetical protein
MAKKHSFGRFVERCCHGHAQCKESHCEQRSGEKLGRHNSGHVCRFIGCVHVDADMVVVVTLSMEAAHHHWFKKGTL